MFWPFTVWINCSSDLENFANSRPSASNFKSFSQSLKQFFLTVGQNNFVNKIPFFRQPTTKRQYRKRDESWTPDKKSRLGRTDSYSRAVSTAQLTQEQQEMFDKFELPKPIDEFKMPPSKGINRKSHIGKQHFLL